MGANEPPGDRVDPQITPPSAYREYVLQAFRELGKNEFVPFERIAERARELMEARGILHPVDYRYFENYDSPCWRVQMNAVRASLLYERLIVKNDAREFRLADLTP